MALATRSKEDRDAFLEYARSVDVPEVWRSENVRVVLTRARSDSSNEPDSPGREVRSMGRRQLNTKKK